MGRAELLREGWLSVLDWLGGRQLGSRRLVTVGVMGGALLALLGGAQVARAAAPPWTATVTKSDCATASLTVALNNTSTQPVVFSMWQNTTYKSGFPPGREAATEVWQKEVAPGQTATEQVGVAPDDSFGHQTVVIYTMFVNELQTSGRPGRQLRQFSGSQDACANQPQPVQAGLQWVAQQGVLGMVQLFAGATQAMTQASSSLLGVNSPSTAGESDKITSGTAILAGTVTTGPDAGDTRYGMMRGVGIIIMVILITLVVIASLAKRQPGEPIASIFMWAPIALIAGGVVFFFADALIGAVDQITYWMISPDWAQVGAYLTALQKVYDPSQLNAADGWQLGVVFVGALLTLVSSLTIFVMLLLRTIALDLLVLFIPMAFAGLVAPWTRNWTGKVVEAFIGLVFTKFVILVVLGTGIVALGLAGGALSSPHLAGASAGGGQDQVQSLTGIVASFVLLIAAAFAPAFSTRLIPMAKGHLEGAVAGGGGYGEAASGGLHSSSAAVYQRASGHARGIAGGAGGTAQVVGRGVGKGAAATAAGVRRSVESISDWRQERNGEISGRQVRLAAQDESQAMARLRRMEQEQLVRTRATETPEERDTRQLQAFNDLRRKRSYHDELDQRSEG